jgi:hypothetical protein
MGVESKASSQVSIGPRIAAQAIGWCAALTDPLRSPFAIRERRTRSSVFLKPQDVMVLLKLAASRKKASSYHVLASELGMSSSEVHKALGRCVCSRLAIKGESGIRPVGPALLEFLAHGIRYVFPPERGGMTRGMPTASAAPPLDRQFWKTDQPPPVWPDSEGSVRGLAFSPLYRSVVHAARNDPALYELLALVDAVRGGEARERRLAVAELTTRLRKAK